MLHIICLHGYLINIRHLHGWIINIICLLVWMINITHLHDPSSIQYTITLLLGQCNTLAWMNDHIISFENYLINIICAYTLTWLLDQHNTLAWLLDQYNTFAWVDYQHNTLAWLYGQYNPFTWPDQYIHLRGCLINIILWHGYMINIIHFYGSIVNIIHLCIGHIIYLSARIT